MSSYKLLSSKEATAGTVDRRRPESSGTTARKGPVFSHHFGETGLKFKCDLPRGPAQMSLMLVCKVYTCKNGEADGNTGNRATADPPALADVIADDRTAADAPVRRWGGNSTTASPYFQVQRCFECHALWFSTAETIYLSKYKFTLFSEETNYGHTCQRFFLRGRKNLKRR